MDSINNAPPKLKELANIKISAINSTATETLLISTKSDNTFLNVIGCLTTKCVIPYVAPTITARNKMIPKTTEKIIWLFGVSNIPTDEGITIASNSATTNKPTMIKENNNLKLNTCWLFST